MCRNIEILDSTLRDGSQAQDITFSVEDKIRIVKILDDLAISYIEAGNPFSNPKDEVFFEVLKDIKLKNSKIVAFGSTRRKNTRPEDDNNLKALLKTSVEYVSLFGKTWDLHVEKILNTSFEENLLMIEESCRFLTDNGVTVFFDAEHFFDGYKSNKAFSIDCLKAAVRGGAKLLVLCDTNGGTLPFEMTDIIRDIQDIFPDIKIGIHAHNDSAVACAVSVMAAQMGIDHIQGTLIGFGERCGNANLSAIIPNLQLKLGYLCIPEDKLRFLTRSCRQIAEISNMSIPKSTPYIGISAFSHKAGMHIDAVSKVSSSFEHIKPSVVGNTRHFLLSEFSGKTALIDKIKKINLTIGDNKNKLEHILQDIKEQEKDGYHFEGADASFQLLIRKHLGEYRSFFELINYKIIVDNAYKQPMIMSAVVKVRVGSKERMTAAEGNGPLNALDLALKKSLADFYPDLIKMHLVDYKVRVIDSVLGTASRVRVITTFKDQKSTWNTIGVSSNVIEASLIALVDSIQYKLIKDHEETR
ncbi:MAG: citramalate synthase [Clostridia bacterium]|nr:citramalate synthase [Clostridia bacterium]